MQDIEDTAYAFLGIVLDVLHVGLNHLEAELVDHLVEFLDALFVGRDLGLQIGDVLGRVAARVGTGGQQVVERFFT